MDQNICVTKYQRAMPIQSIRNNVILFYIKTQEHRDRKY